MKKTIDNFFADYTKKKRFTLMGIDLLTYGSHVFAFKTMPFLMGLLFLILVVLYLLLRIYYFIKIDPDELFWTEILVLFPAFIFNVYFTGMLLLLGYAIKTGNFAP